MGGAKGVFLSSIVEEDFIGWTFVGDGSDIACLAWLSTGADFLFVGLLVQVR